MDLTRRKRPIVVRQGPDKVKIYRESDSDETLPDLVTPDGKPIDWTSVSHINLPKVAHGTISMYCLL